jgi:hypothetical protein
MSPTFDLEPTSGRSVLRSLARTSKRGPSGSGAPHGLGVGGENDPVLVLFLAHGLVGLEFGLEFPQAFLIAAQGGLLFLQGADVFVKCVAFDLQLVLGLTDFAPGRPDLRVLFGQVLDRDLDRTVLDRGMSEFATQLFVVGTQGLQFLEDLQQVLGITGLAVLSVGGRVAGLQGGDFKIEFLPLLLGGRRVPCRAGRPFPRVGGPA